MDQKELRELENKCIQEEPAECVAACPIHVDARSFVRHVRDRAWDEAWKILKKNMPFPSILGRICDAPCRKRCKRGEAGDPIEIGALERACVTRAGPPLRMPPVVKKDRKVAVLGSGLSSLTAAWDLGRKGYQVAIFEPSDEPGGLLEKLPEEVLPGREIQEAISILGKLGATLEKGVTVDSKAFQNRCIEEFDAVFAGLDAATVGEWNIKKNENGGVAVEPGIQSTSIEKVFAGGNFSESSRSFVWQAAEGRWAATSIDRFLQNVSMTAGREKEGPCKTRLFTSLKG